MKNLEKFDALVKQIVSDTNKCYEKGVFSRGREARKGLSELAKLCKDLRKDILDRMNELKSDK